MLPLKDYMVFSKKLAIILKDCYLTTHYPNDVIISIQKDLNLSPDEVAFASGCSSLTEGNIYLFKKENAKKHKEELLDICLSLPKMKTVLTGTAGTIAYTDLLPDMQTNLNALIQHCQHADKFIGLLQINEIGYGKSDMVGNENFKASPISLAYRYKNQINPDE